MTDWKKMGKDQLIGNIEIFIKASKRNKEKIQRLEDERDDLLWRNECLNDTNHQLLNMMDGLIDIMGGKEK